jgi:DNA-binding MarR family transcriptional regulator
VAKQHRLALRSEPDDGEGTVSLGPLPGYVGFVLRRVQRVVFSEFIAELGALDLRPAQYAVLEAVAANPGLRQSDAAAALGIQKANFVGLVSELERRALLIRRRSSVDRRSYALHLGARGRHLLKRARLVRATQEARLAEALGADGRNTLLDLLQRLAAPGR